MWWAFYLFSVGSGAEWLNWSIAGAVFLTVLFTVPGAPHLRRDRAHCAPHLRRDRARRRHICAGSGLCAGASLDVTEALSSRKYAAYPEYQRRVSRFFPWPPAPSVAAGSSAAKARTRAASPAKSKPDTKAEKVVTPAKPKARARSTSPASTAKSPNSKSPARSRAKAK